MVVSFSECRGVRPHDPMIPLPARIHETWASRVCRSSKSIWSKRYLRRVVRAWRRRFKPGRERRGLGEDMLWLQVEEWKGTLAGIGLDCGLYARVCPIYHE